MTKIPIIQLVSFSRSGETLLLRSLEAHSRIEVVHQIREPDDPRDIALFQGLMKRPEDWIDAENKLLHHRKLAIDNILLLKNAVWIHEAPHQGFILIRNPFSVMKSAYVTGHEKKESYAAHKKQCRRWGTGIDKNMLPFVMNESNLTAFCTLYTRKMVAAYMSGLPIVHYEEFVQEPEKVMRELLPALGLEWEERVLRSHENYHEGQLGHGRIKLWQPIHAKSLDSYTALNHAAFDSIYALTAPALELYGYKVRDREVSITPDFDRRRHPGVGRRLQH